MCIVKLHTDTGVMCVAVQSLPSICSSVLHETTESELIGLVLYIRIIYHEKKTQV